MIHRRWICVCLPVVVWIASWGGRKSDAADPPRPDAVKHPDSPVMLDLPGIGTDPTKIDFSKLPRLKGQHAVVSRGDERMAVLPIPSNRGETLQYPHVIEHDGHLHVAFSRNKTNIEALKVALDELNRLRD